MEWNEKPPSQWEWQNLFICNAKANENSKMQPIEWAMQADRGINQGCFYLSGGGGSDPDFGHTSLSNSLKSASVDSYSIGESKTSKLTLETFRDFPNDFHRKKKLAKVETNGTSATIELPSSSGETLLSLKLATTAKKCKSTCHGTQTLHCQVEGCNLDLSLAKVYHRKHRVCESHSKSPKVIVGGLELRFCQQCSRFHGLSEFDEKKRSCRRRLSDHNARRRKQQPEAVRLNSARLSSSNYDGKQQMNLVFDRVPLVYTSASVSSTWEDICSSKFTQAKEYPPKPAKTIDTDIQLHFPHNEMPCAISALCDDSSRILSSKGTVADVLNPGLEEPMIVTGRGSTQDFRHALSLLSTNSWGSRESKPAPPHPHSNHAIHYSTSLQPAMQVIQGLPHTLSDSRAHILGSPNNGIANSHDFQLFRSPCEFGFLSNQFN